MKKSATIIFLLLVMFKVQAQDYLISFAGTGDTTVVSTVKVHNLRSGETVTLNGGDILHLTAYVGTDKLDKNNEAMQLYPNPMEGHAFLTFFAPKNGDALIRIVDLSGKTVYQMSKLLSPGNHSFRVTGIRQGLNLLKVTGQNYNYSTKFMSLNNQQNLASIEYVSSVKNASENHLKSTAARIDMLYTEGDHLLFKSTTGQYSTIITNVPSSSKIITFNYIKCTDADNNNYSTVKIGTQVWMAENLKTTKYNDGTSIPLVTEQSGWVALSTPGYCWYNNDIANKNTYGGLYNWFTVNTSKLAPLGWHVPTDTEFTTLSNSLGHADTIGVMLRENGTTHWSFSGLEGTNITGFTGLPGGHRIFDGVYEYVGFYGHWWCSTLTPSEYPYVFSLGYNYRNLYLGENSSRSGYSVRCLRD